MRAGMCHCRAVRVKDRAYIFECEHGRGGACTDVLECCTWQHVLDQVVNPSALWSGYEPGNLGHYLDIKSLWQAWEEGTYVTNIGRKPALQMIDAKWGNLESQDTGRRKLPSWRPRNDGMVCLCFLAIQANDQ